MLGVLGWVSSLKLQKQGHYQIFILIIKDSFHQKYKGQSSGLVAELSKHV